MNTNRRRWEDLASESVWLLAAAFAPLFFNIESARHFEADKAVGVRLLAIAAIAIEAIRGIREPFAAREGIRSLARETRLVRVVLAGVFLFTGSTLLSTAVSVAPRLSWWGSYERRQGAYTILAYVAIFAIACLRLDRTRIERLTSVLGHAGVAASLYALLQVSGLDPIPWTTDAARRPTSTFGNPGTLAGFLILVVPFLVIRFVATARARSAERRVTFPDATWRLVGLVGSHALFLGSVFVLGRSVGSFGEPMRLVAAIALAVFAWALRGAPDESDRAFFAGGVFASAAAWIAMTVLGVATGRSTAGAEAVATGLAIAIVVFWARRERGSPSRDRPPAPSRAPRGRTRAQVLGNAFAVAVCCAAVLLAQARGPQIALFVSLIVLANIVLFATPPDRAAAGTEKLRVRRIAGVAGQAVVVLALLGFNLSTSPLAARARDLPYVGRLGKWLLFSEGTGRERLIIWRGDSHGAGMLGLVTESPLRMIFGHGPETLKESFARVFPPSLVEGASRELSPDRAHQVELDTWYTQGLVGLTALLLVYGAAMALAFRRSFEGEERARILSLACLGAIVAHVVEGFAEIPSTASLLGFFTIVAILIALSRTAVTDAAAPPRPFRSHWGAVLLVAALALVACWRGNLSSVAADMMYHAGHRFAEDVRLEPLVERCDKTLAAMDLAPREDAYAADLGQVLLLLSRTKTGTAEEAHELERRASRCSELVARNDAHGLLVRARAVLEHAHALRPLDKDRATNLAEIEAHLFESTGDRSHLEESIRWYEQASTLAPNHVRILDGRAGVLIAAGPEHHAEAEALVRRSLDLDPSFLESYVVLGELLLARQRPAEAAEAYARVLRRRPGLLRFGGDGRFRRIVSELRSEGDFLGPLELALEEYLDELHETLAGAPFDERGPITREIAATAPMLSEVRRGR